MIQSKLTSCFWNWLVLIDLWHHTDTLEPSRLPMTSFTVTYWHEYIGIQIYKSGRGWGGGVLIEQWRCPSSSLIQSKFTSCIWNWLVLIDLWHHTDTLEPCRLPITWFSSTGVDIQEYRLIGHGGVNLTMEISILIDSKQVHKLCLKLAAFNRPKTSYRHLGTL